MEWPCDDQRMQMEAIKLLVVLIVLEFGCGVIGEG